MTRVVRSHVDPAAFMLAMVTIAIIAMIVTIHARNQAANSCIDRGGQPVTAPPLSKHGWQVKCTWGANQ